MTNAERDLDDSLGPGNFGSFAVERDFGTPAHRSTYLDGLPARHNFVEFKNLEHGFFRGKAPGKAGCRTRTIATSCNLFIGEESVGVTRPKLLDGRFDFVDWLHVNSNEIIHVASTN